MTDHTNFTREDRIQPAAGRGGPVRGVLWAALCCSAAALALSIGALTMAWPKAEPEPVSEPEAVEAFSPVEYLTYRNHQLPIDGELAVNAWSPSDFSRDDRGWTLCEGTVTGIDVSSHQGEIDWERVADSGVEFAMIRAGYRGYGPEGKLMEDEKFHTNIQSALAAGLDVGVYFFSQATNVWEAEEEAQLLLRSLEGYPVTYPVVFDWERIHHSAARTDGVEGKTVTLMAQAFCAQVEQAGYTPGVYFNQDMGYLSFDLSELAEFSFWLAEYDSKPDFYYDFSLWQYSSTGTVDGIQGNVDLNLDFSPFAP